MCSTSLLLLCVQQVAESSYYKSRTQENDQDIAKAPIVEGLPRGIHVEAWSFAPPPTFSHADCLDEVAVTQLHEVVCGPWTNTLCTCTEQATTNSIFSFVNEDDIICRASLGGVRELGRRLRVLAYVRRAGCVHIRK